MNAAIIYVAQGTKGEVCDGSRHNPYSTLQQAKEHVRRLRQTQEICEIRVKIATGNYFLEQPLAFEVEDSGSPLCSVIYEGDTNGAREQVILTGAKKLDINQWEPEVGRSHIWFTYIEKGLKLDGLVLNGKPQTLCRYPNFVEGALPLGSAATAEEIKARVQQYEHVKGGYIRALHHCRWGGNSYKILGKDAEHPLGLSLEWVGDNNRGSAFDHEAVVIENIYEELDAPEEWYYNPKSGKLAIFKTPNMNLDQMVCEGIINSELIQIVGDKAGEKAGHLTFEGIHFMHTKRTLFTVDEPKKHYTPLLRGDWCVVRTGAVLIQDAEEVTLRNCHFDQIGGNAIFINGYNKGHKIEDNIIENVGASCIQVAGLPEAVYEPSFWKESPNLSETEHAVHKTFIEEKHCTGPKSMHYPREIYIMNNYMCNMGIFEKQSSGVNLSVCSRCKILNNTIHNSPRACINVNDGTFGGHEIAYNDIFDAQKETTDHGPFNSWGRDRFWSVPCYNASGLYGDQIRPYALLDAIEPVKLHDNRFHHGADQPHTWGIDLDDGSSHYEIYNNLCLGLGIKLREGFDRKVYNNILMDGSFNIHCTYAEASDQIFRNVVICDEPWKFAGQQGGDNARLKVGKYKIDGNIYYTEGAQVSLPDFFEAEGYDIHGSMNQDPQFENPLEENYTITNVEVITETGFCNLPKVVYGSTKAKVKGPHYVGRTYRPSGASLVYKWLGATLTAIDEGIISSTASSGYKGAYIKEVPLASQAYALGLHEQDLLREVNGEKLQQLEESWKVLEKIDATSIKQLKVWRQTQNLILK
ncbi:MAG: hypothetical protein RR090_02370 [Niameybacter sp.]|uniref:hypothetical protein n=1 Tax=Niameybacter sp. TaxID=2033640 RepID=UPI002FC96CA1